MNNDLENQLLGLLAAHPAGLSVPELRTRLRPAPSQPTLSRRLLELRARGLVVKAGAARATKYLLAGGRHRLAELRSQALHAAVAEKLLRNPAYKERALERLKKLKEFQPASLRYLERWEHLLLGNEADLLRMMTAPGEYESTMRSASPFAGILTQKERKGIYERFSLKGVKCASANSDQFLP